MADLIGANQKDIVFTSGATESNNMSIKGIARFFKGKKKHMYARDLSLQTEVSLLMMLSSVPSQHHNSD